MGVFGVYSRSVMPIKKYESVMMDRDTFDLRIRKELLPMIFRNNTCGLDSVYYKIPCFKYGDGYFRGPYCTSGYTNFIDMVFKRSNLLCWLRINYTGKVNLEISPIYTNEMDYINKNIETFMKFSFIQFRGRGFNPKEINLHIPITVNITPTMRRFRLFVDDGRNF